MANWHARYETLKRYIADHPTIEITSSGTSIPGDVRTGFYEIFDDILAEFVRERYASQISEAALAISKYSEAKARLASIVDRKIEVNPNLQFFLADPVTGLTRSTFTLLLSLLRNNISIEDFERESDKIIQDSYPSFMREIYLQWATLSLITLLGPDQVYSVPVPDETHDPHYTESELRPGNYEDIPQVVPAEKIMLFGSHYVPMIVPKLVFHSSRLDTYVAIRTDYHKVFCLAKKLHEIIKGLEWYQLKDIVNKFGVFNLWPDIGLYLDDNP
jgi:DNA-binding transcriptional ArsR family regulator